MSETKTQVSAEEFKSAMAVYMSKGTYPLEAISMIAAEDESGKFFFVTIADYITGGELFTGPTEGFPTRAAALGFVGELWDHLDAAGRKFQPRLTIEQAKTRNS